MFGWLRALRNREYYKNTVLAKSVVLNKINGKRKIYVLKFIIRTKSGADVKAIKSTVDCCTVRELITKKFNSKQVFVSSLDL